jgi:hypothetical protein
MEHDLTYKVGQLSASVAALQGDVSEIKTDQKAQLGMLQQLVAKDAEHRGARKTVRAIAGYATGSGALAALLTWVLDHWVSK